MNLSDYYLQFLAMLWVIVTHRILVIFTLYFDLRLNAIIETITTGKKIVKLQLPVVSLRVHSTQHTTALCRYGQRHIKINFIFKRFKFANSFEFV